MEAARAAEPPAKPEPQFLDDVSTFTLKRKEDEMKPEAHRNTATRALDD